MNIAFYSHYFAPEIGAPSARVRELSLEWLRQGEQVDVVTGFPNHPTGKIYDGYKKGLYFHENMNGIHVHRQWTYFAPNAGFLRKTLGHISYLPACRWIGNKRIRSPDATVGTSPTFFAAMAAAACAKRYRVPFVMDVRDLWPAAITELGVIKNRIVVDWLERLELSLYHRATRVVTVTDAFRENLLSRGIPPDKVEVVPNGADVDYWQPGDRNNRLRNTLGLQESFVVLYIGAHGISHSLHKIIQAAAKLSHIPAIRFLFVGEGAEKNKVVDEAQRLGLDNVQFIDAVEKSAVRDYYQLADVCLVPLRNVPLFETFIPSKIFEIMAMARPIVASVAGEAAQILERSGSALVVPPEDVAGIAGSIEHLHCNRAECSERGNSGRQFVEEHYSRKALANKYRTVLYQARRVDCIDNVDNTHDSLRPAA